jgi:DNA polymerase-3 subunit epsilon
MHLFFDTETTALPNFKLSSTDPSQPHICQIAAILTDPLGKVQAELNLLIRPEGWMIPEETTAIHGITQAAAEKYGIHVKGAMSLFWRLLSCTEVLVAHNISFDIFLLRIAAHRCGLPDPKEMPFARFCTMQESKNILKLPPTEKMKATSFKNSYKSPTLQEVHEYFFNEKFMNAHDAMADVRACRDVYHKIKAHPINR